MADLREVEGVFQEYSREERGFDEQGWIDPGQVMRFTVQEIVDVLDIPRLVVPVFGMCLGWPASAPEVKPRMPVDLVLHQDEYRDAPEEQIAAYDETLAAYYRSRSANTKQRDWSSTAAASVQGKKREHVLAFLQQQGFFKR